MMNQYTDRSYAEELRLIRERLLQMAGRVEEMIELSIRALVERDSDLASETILMDRQVNQDEVDLDAMCLELLARRQPMASDLRFVILSMKMVTDLERIGDLAVNICERSRDLSRKPSIGPFEKIPRMAQIVREMLHCAIDSFVEKNVEEAHSVIVMDDEVDELYHQVFRTLLDMMRAEPKVVHRGIHVQSVAKFLERIGDHATNLAEQVIHMHDGTDVRHEGKLSSEE